MPSTSDKPVISVVMPVRNGGPWLRVAVNSILSQTFRSFELIIIDDGSRDGQTTRLVGQHPRLHVLRNPGRGIVDALNHGIAVARGDWIARMDADDIAIADRFSKQLAYVHQNPNVHLVGAEVRIFKTNSNGDNAVGGGYLAYENWVNRLHRHEDIIRELFIESPIPHPTAFIHRATLRKVGGYRHAPWPEDYDLWLRMAEFGVRMGKPRGVLLHWRDHDARLSRNTDNCSNSAFVRLKTHYLTRRFRHHPSVVIWGGGKSGRLVFDHFKRFGMDVSAFIDVHPRRTGREVRGRRVLPVASVGEVTDPIIVAVGARGARRHIRSALSDFGHIEGETYVFAM